MTPSSSSRVSVRLAPLALAVVFVASACVSLDPVESAKPTQASPRATPSGQPNVTPTPTSSEPGATPTPTQPGATLEPGASATPTPPDSSSPPIDPAVAAEIDTVIQQVPPIRELDPLADVPYELVTRQQFSDELVELKFSEVPEEWRGAEERLYKRLGLLPDDADLDELLLDLFGAQAAAYYRPDTKRFYVITDNEDAFSASDKIAVAHEYTHALQDQHFDLEATRVKDLTEGDATLGQLGAVEGDATLSMQQWTEDHLSPEEALEVLFESIQQLDDQTLTNMPWIIRRQLEFPYAEGFGFTQGIYGTGGWDAVNASISTAIPASTEQVLHPDKYLANEAPVVITMPDRSSEMNEGEGSWSMSYQQTMGELQMQVFAAGSESPPETLPGMALEWPHADAVDGWGGDRLNMYEGPDGAWIIDWHTSWDTEADADGFEARVNEIQTLFDGPALITGSGNEVRVVIASDQEALNLLPG